MDRRPFLRSALIAAAVLSTGLAFGQAFPSRPVTLVVPNPPGGLVDTSARLPSDALAKVPEAKARADVSGIEIRYLAPSQLDAMVKRETAFWARTIKAQGITAD